MSMSQDEPLMGNLSDDEYELVACPSVHSDCHDGTTFDVMSLDDYACSSLDSGSDSDLESPSRRASAVIEAIEDLQCDQLSKEMLLHAVSAAQRPVVEAAPVPPAPFPLQQAADAHNPAAEPEDVISSSPTPSATPSTGSVPALNDTIPHDNTVATPAATAALARPPSRRLALLLLVGAYTAAVAALILLGSGSVPSRLPPWSADSVILQGRAPEGSHHHPPSVLHHMRDPADPEAPAADASELLTKHGNLSAVPSPSCRRRDDLNARHNAGMMNASFSNRPTPSATATQLRAKPTCWAANPYILSGPLTSGHVKRHAACKNPKDEPAVSRTQQPQVRRPNPMLSSPVCWEKVLNKTSGAPTRWRNPVRRPFTVLSALMSIARRPDRCQIYGNSTLSTSRTASLAVGGHANPATPQQASTNNTAAAAGHDQDFLSVSAVKRRHLQLSGYRQWVRQQQHQALKQLLQLYPALPAATGVALYKPLPSFSHNLQQQQQASAAWKASNSTQANKLLSANTSTNISSTPGKPGGVAAAAAAAVAAVLRRITQPVKPVPALYVPAPPRLLITADKPSATTGQGLLGGTTAKLSKGARTSQGTSSTLLESTGTSAVGGGLTLPMLPPLIYAAVPGAQGSGAAAAGQSATAAGAAAAGLTLPMLPPVVNKQQQVWQKGQATCGSSGFAGGLTLPMLPPVTCNTCSSELQLLGSSIVTATVVDKNSSDVASSSGRLSGNGWVSTWASLPMLPPKGKPTIAVAAAAEPGPSHLAAEVSERIAELSVSVPTARAYAGAGVQHAAAHFKAARRAEVVAATDSTTTDAARVQLGHKLRKYVGQMQQPIKTLLQLLAVAKGRSLQCNLPVSAPSNSKQLLFGGSSSHSQKVAPAAVAINDAMRAASKLLSLTNKLYVASQRPAWATRRHVQYKYAKSQQDDVQELCMEVGQAHHSLQFKLAAAIFKPMSPQTAAVPARSGLSGRNLKRTAAQHIQPYPGKGYLQYIPSSTAVQPIIQRAAGKNAAELGPMIPLRQQISAASTAAITVGKQGGIAPAGSGRVGYHTKYTASVSRSRLRLGEASRSSMRVLNPGWDGASALAAATAAGELSKAEKHLQKTCHRLAVATRVESADVEYLHNKAARDPAMATGIGVRNERHVRLLLRA